MKKLKLLLISAISAISLCSFASCGKAKVTDIEIKEGYTTSVEIGKFNPSDYFIVETYSDGSTKEVPITDSMITDVGRIRLNTIGDQEIDVTYLGATVKLNLTITRANFDVSISNKVFTYTGNPIDIQIDGYYPKGTTITYPNGNSFTNVGRYNVVAILNAENYETKTVSATYEIVAADYNLDVSFSGKTYTYDEENHKIEVEGNLPKEVSVTYTINGAVGNSAINAGTYEIVAIFSSSNRNYNPIASMKATMVIEKATYNTESISIGKQDVAYDGTLKEWKIVNTLPSWISVSYINTYVPEKGEVVSNSTSYVQKEIGFYTCVIKFKVLNANYNDIEDLSFEVCIYEE